MSDPWRLGGRFDLLEQLGAGASGTVWRGREAADGTEHALKLLRPGLVADSDAVAELYANLNAVAGLGHPAVVAVDEAVVADGWLALRSRLVLGGSLRTALTHQGALPAPYVLSLLAQVCDALAAAHAGGIAHGDIHPANVLIAVGADGAPTASLTDFAMATLVARPALRDAAAPATLTTPPAEYRAPELSSASPITAPADVYALGVLLYECLAGRPPFTAQWPDAVAQMHRQDQVPPIAGISDSLWRTIAACLEKDFRYRPTAAQLTTAVRNEVTAPSAVAVPSAAVVHAMPTQLLPVIPGMSADATQTAVVSGYLIDEPHGHRDRTGHGATAASSRLPRVIREHKTESGIAAAVVVAGVLIAAAMSMGGGEPNNAANAAPATMSAPPAAATSPIPEAVVLPSASPTPSPSASPSASAPVTGDMVFINTLTNKCMDTAGRIFANGTTEDIYDCNGTPAQVWTVTPTGQLTQDGGAYCLDDLDFGNTPGSRVALWSCNGGTNQQWTLHDDGSITGDYANLCLDVSGQGGADTTPLVLSTCDGSSSQQWARH